MKAYLIGCIFVVVGIVLGALLFFGVLFKACVDVEKQQQRYANLPEVHGVITTTTPLKARFQQGMATVIEYRVMRKRHFAVDSDLDYKLERFLVGAESLVFIDSAGKRYTVEFNVNRIPIKNFSETVFMQLFSHDKGLDIHPYLGIHDQLDCYLQGLLNQSCESFKIRQNTYHIKVWESFIPVGSQVTLKGRIEGDRLVLLQ